MRTVNKVTIFTNIGIRLGFKVAFRLSTIWLILYLTLGIVSSFIGKPLLPFYWFGSLLLVTVLIIVVGTLIGILPACLIGAITGWLITVAIRRFQNRLSVRTTAVLGVLISLAIALPLNLVLSASIISNGPAYLFFLGIPSIIYMLAGAYIGVHLHRQNIQTSRKV